MPGLMSRILSRRADGAPDAAPVPSDAPAADQPTVVVPAHGDGQIAPTARTVETPAIEEPETATAVVAAEPEPPAVAEPEAAQAATLGNRGAMRRRLRYLRRVREIGFRDLGGLVFDLDRFGRERPDLVALKLRGLQAIDAELRTLELALGDVRDVEELHEPGISACGRCGALHGSDARFCPACGQAVDAPPPAAVELPAAAPDAVAGSEPAA